MQELPPRPPDDRAVNLRLRGTVDGSELVLPLRDGLNRLGSDAENDLMLSYEGVSRQHAIVLVERGRAEVVDCGSKNGTFVNGERVERAHLEAGALLRIGCHELILEPVAPEDAVMAWEMTPAPGPRAVPEAETTASMLEPSRAGRWLAIMGTVADHLRRSGGASAALDLLCAESGAETAHFCRLCHQVEVLATCGEPEASALEGLHQHWSRDCARAADDPQRVFSRPPLHAVTSCEPVPAGGERWGGALVFEGMPILRDDVREALPSLLAFFLLWAGGPRSAGARRAGHRVGALHFPAGYVRGRSLAMDHLHGQMLRAAQGDMPVLIAGETGVGKEWVARILHASSSRRAGPLVAINCAAIPAELLEAELFGIGKNVATGVAARHGKFGQAHGGSLFLDEVGEMPQALQAKLLRVLQEGRLEPIGAPARDIDVRLLAATNADIDAMVEHGSFRRDLFFRLAGFVLDVPPLRQRRQDIPAFVESIARDHALNLGKPIRGLSVGALRALMAEDWPGNVRQLEHHVRRLVHLCPENAAIDSTLLSTRPAPSRDAEPAASSPAGSGDGWPELDLARLEREAVREALRQAEGNQVRAAKLLGISRYSLRRRLGRHGLA